MQPMSPMAPMSPMEHSQSQSAPPQTTEHSTQPQPHHPLNNMRNNMSDPMDVSMMQAHHQQQTTQPQGLLSTMNQYSPPVSNNYSMQTNSTTEQMCVNASVNGHDVQMNDFNNGLIRKIKTNDETVLHQSQLQTVQSMQHSQQFLLSAGPSDRNNYGMNLKQEPEVNF